MKQLPNIEQKTVKHSNGQLVTPANEHKFAYYFLARDKKSQPWKCIAFAYAPGDCCLAAAREYFKQHGFVEQDYRLTKLTDNREWHRLQLTQHLKQVGVKLK